MSAVPMAGTGRGPRPDPTTFTRQAIDGFDETTDLPNDTTARFDDDTTTEHN